MPRPSRHALLPLVALAFTAGACLNANRFLEQFMEARCKWQKACQTAHFEDNWSSIGDCVSAETERIEELRADCSYSRKQAKECLDAADTWFAECAADYEKYQAYIDQCEQVYTCPEDEDEGGETGETGMGM